MVLRDKAKTFLQHDDQRNLLEDPLVRQRKAEKILAVLRNEISLPDPKLRLLDLGCSSGHILTKLADSIGFGVGADMDISALVAKHSKIAYTRTDGEKLPFASDSFDIVVCNHVYEHTSSAAEMATEIYRVLKNSGVCYLAGPNKYEIMEPHYRLPFLSWLPSSSANHYVRLFNRGEGYPEKPLPLSQVRVLFQQFAITDYTAIVLADPENYWVEDILPPESAKHWLARFIFKWLRIIFPGFILILKKPQGKP